MKIANEKKMNDTNVNQSDEWKRKLPKEENNILRLLSSEAHFHFRNRYEYDRYLWYKYFWVVINENNHSVICDN